MFRLDPQMPAQNYKTYELRAPVSTHYKDVTCIQANCTAMANGWTSLINEATELGKKQAHYIRRNSKREFTEERTKDGLTKFTFSAGQKCFETHKDKLNRPPLLFVKGGDWRGNPRGTRPFQHKNAEDWIEDFSEHQDRLKTRLEQG